MEKETGTEKPRDTRRERKGGLETRKEKKKWRKKHAWGRLIEVPASLKLSLQPHLALSGAASSEKVEKQQKAQINRCTVYLSVANLSAQGKHNPAPHPSRVLWPSPPAAFYWRPTALDK